MKLRLILLAAILAIAAVLSFSGMALGDGTDPMPLCKKRVCIP